MNIKIFLDLDGVIRDWVGGVESKFDIKFTPTHYGEIEDIIQTKGLSVSEFWEAQDRDFWVGLKMYPWAEELISFLESKTNNICILTSPTLNSAGYTQEWIKIHLPKYFNSKQYLIGPAKYYCADNRSILIDDKEETITQFNLEGGQGVLFPQYWNYYNFIRNSNDQIDYIKLVIEEIIHVFNSK